MKFNPVEVVDSISGQQFRKEYLSRSKPLVIRNLSDEWQATDKWTFEYFKQVAGSKVVPVYDNRRPAPHTKVNHPDGEMTFSEYLDLIVSGPSDLRIFLFNVYKNTPELCRDFNFPDKLSNSFLKKYSMLFFGGQGAKVYLHYDIDMSHIFLTQFLGRKKVYLFERKYSKLLYRLPFMVQSYIDPENPDYEMYPALKQVEGYYAELQHGDTLFIPAGTWHYMGYEDGGFALSLRALSENWLTRLQGLYNLFVMRNIDDFFKKHFTQSWYNYKHEKAKRRAIPFVKQEEHQREYAGDKSSISN